MSDRLFFKELACEEFTSAHIRSQLGSCGIHLFPGRLPRQVNDMMVLVTHSIPLPTYLHLAEKDLRPLFKGRLIKDRIYTGWGSHQLVEAERNLLWHAYQDPANTRCVEGGGEVLLCGLQELWWSRF